MSTPMYSHDGSPVEPLDIPEDVVLAAQRLISWCDSQDPSGEWQFMGLGLVGPHVARAKAQQTKRIMAIVELTMEPRYNAEAVLNKLL